MSGATALFSGELPEYPDKCFNYLDLLHPLREAGNVPHNVMYILLNCSFATGSPTVGTYYVMSRQHAQSSHGSAYSVFQIHGSQCRKLRLPINIH